MTDFSSEISFKTARSGGKGGQNVNKVETMVEALWDIANSRFFSPEQKESIYTKLENKLNSDGLLSVKCSETRSQLENKEIARGKMIEIVAKSLVIPKKRKPTKPTKSAIESRLQTKKKDAVKKTNRRSKPSAED